MIALTVVSKRLAIWESESPAETTYVTSVSGAAGPEAAMIVGWGGTASGVAVGIAVAVASIGGSSLPPHAAARRVRQAMTADVMRSCRS